MRRAKSYSIVDHQFLHQGSFQSLRRESLILYFFYVLVGDYEGKNYYGEKSLRSALKFSDEELVCSLQALTKAGLIIKRGKYTFVTNFNEENKNNGQNDRATDQVSEGYRATKLSSNRGETWHLAGDVLANILRESQKDTPQK